MQFVVVPRSQIITTLFFFGIIIQACHCEEITMEINDNNKTAMERPYCFRFTWLGPKFNEESQFKNATCSDVIKGDKSVPCTHPLVVTNNSNIPDTEYIWNKYRDKPTQVACRLVKGEVCAKVSYKFNDAVENITYLCTKVNVENETAVSTGCYRQMKNGHELELCLCETAAGMTPCNVAIRNVESFSVLVNVILSFIILFCVIVR